MLDCPVELLATAESEWLPFVSVVVLRERLKGAVVTGAPELLPSTLNCTLVVLEETLVETVVVPETVAPESGEVIEIVGAVELLTVTMTVALVPVCPAELPATAESEWVPFVRVVVLREKLKGARVTAAPELLPSTLNCTLVVLEETLVETVVVPETVAPESGEVIEIVGGVELLTVTMTVALVAFCPAMSLATAESEWVPLENDVVFREKLKGALVTGAPELLPSTLNCTLVVLEETLVVTVVVPETVAPESGEVIEIVGAVELLTVIVTVALVAFCPAMSLATAESEWVPLESDVVFREKLKGARVTGAPELLPSNLNCTLVVLGETLVVTVMVPETVASESGEVIEMVGAVELLTVSETAALVLVCPAELLATAESEWVPLESVVVLREKLKGALVTGAPELLPSNLNCTLVVLAETLVETVVVPETVAPESGEVIEIAGAAELLTVIITVALVVISPDEFEATAVSECVPGDNLVVSSEESKGALVTVAPTLFPSTMNSTLVVFEETLVVSEMSPDTVASGAGAVKKIVGGVDLDAGPFFMSALVRPTHPKQNSDEIKIKQ